VQTQFSAAALADPAMRDSESALRKCVHCGFCTSTCPTYVELGDELDSPRGRIYLMKAMLEQGRPATPRDVLHIDRCLSCLSCVTTCPSGVNYMHLVDQTRAWIEQSYRRPLADRLLRSTLACVLPHRSRFRIALRIARIARPLRRARFLSERLRALLAQVPAHLPVASAVDRPQRFEAQGGRRLRVALLGGCVQPVLAPQINEASVRLLTRLGCEVVIPRDAGCCGALTHHMGKEERAQAAARANVDAWWQVHEQAPLDAIVINASGCGTTVKDYGRLLRTDPAYAPRAAALAAKARDITEILTSLGLGGLRVAVPFKVTYHAPCSLQHGQQIRAAPLALLRAAGFRVCEPADAHLCCGSAGTYNILQPQIASRLLARKLRAIQHTSPDVIASGNIGCLKQLAGVAAVPVLHTVELLDWATGGPVPTALQALLTRPAAPGSRSP
jgi:glycolate oxidase iron-sulfur subunit